MKKALILEIIIALLVLLFLYASFSKYADITAFKRSMHNQPVPRWLSDSLIVFLPPFEITIAIGLIFEKSRRKALYAFTILMIVFTIYIFAIIIDWFPKHPCSCGELIQSLTWGQHFVFNLMFVFLGLLSLALQRQLAKQNVTTTNRNQNKKDISRAKSG